MSTRTDTLTIAVGAAPGGVARDMRRTCALCGSEAWIQEDQRGRVLASGDCRCGATKPEPVYHAALDGKFGGGR